MSNANWTRETVTEIYQLPLMELLYQAHCIHRQNFNPTEIKISSLLSIKTGTCPEDCAFCPQSGHFKTGVQKEKILPLEDVIAKAKMAKKNGATRFCLTAAWRGPAKQDFEKVIAMVKAVKELGLEVCITIGKLTAEHAIALKQAGLDYYNHNLETSPEFYPKIVSTHSYQDRLDTLEHVRNANIKVCCGGIIGLGETQADRIGLLLQLATLPKYPDSVTINLLIPISGTPLADTPKLSSAEFIRTVATARILMPKAFVRLSGGRNSMNLELQTLCFFAGANSIHSGNKLIITPIPGFDYDKELIHQLGATAI